MTLARLDNKNALTNEMYRVLAEAIEQAGSDRSIRVVLLQADGDSFTAGNDMGEFAAMAVGKGPSERHVTHFLRALAEATVPIIAAVNGKAVGIGTTLLLHCDYVLLAQDAQLITPFVNLALVPEAASSYLLPLRVGHARAFEMFALGEALSAQTALALGHRQQGLHDGTIEQRGAARGAADRRQRSRLGRRCQAHDRRPGARVVLPATISSWR